MIAGVITETLAGERRVALVPSVVPALAKIGVSVLVQQGAGAAAGFTDAAFAEKGAEIAPSAGDVVAKADLLLRVRVSPEGTEAGRQDLALLRPGPCRDCVSRSAERARSRAIAGGEERHRLLDGADAAHHARPEHGRALVDGDNRRLQGRAARGEHAAAHVPHADDSRGHRDAGESVRHRRRRRGAAGDLDRPPARRAGRGVRRASGVEGTGAERRREVRRAADRSGGCRGQGRLRKGAGRVVLPPPARDDDEGRGRAATSSSRPPPSPGRSRRSWSPRTW